MNLNTYDYEKLFFDIDDDLKFIRNLKEKYIDFNSSGQKDFKIIENKLDDFIYEYYI